MIIILLNSPGNPVSAVRHAAGCGRHLGQMGAAEGGVCHGAVSPSHIHFPGPTIPAVRPAHWTGAHCGSIRACAVMFIILEKQI